MTQDDSLEELKRLYIMYHSPWNKEGEKDKYWKQIKRLSAILYKDK